MTIKDIFLKPVDRHIDGVIKADDERSLLTEVEEYVITAEVHKSLGRVLDYYLNNKVVNGAWISGFFGSGKSHLLKMLALLLENREIENQKTLDLFLAKVTDDPLFKANLEKACTIPSKSILFNIAQKANKMSKDHTETLLGTFVKVFDEMCGYYGNLGYIAQFERDLDNQGMLTQFKETYISLMNRQWEDDRRSPHLRKRSIGKVYSEVTKTPEAEAITILDRYRNDYAMSIEDFANLVNDYIKRQEKGFRLNFFVDEVGQYIADDVRLMTDLQTIAESLATKTGNRAWIFVTSQQNMESILGEMTKQTGHDFSKIQGRFKAKVNLSSANVDEVIRLRLLAKNDDGKDVLDPVFSNHQNNFKTLFDFPDGAKKYKGYENRQQFVNTYPFAPYQVTLFQSAIQNLSKHDAFTGQYQSVGERSMLEVFQEVVKRIAKEEVGHVAPFNLMFEGIRDDIKSTVRQGVTQAERQLPNTFTQDVLKVLFLVKYVKEFQTTPRNITVLMIEDFNQDIQALRKRVEESLATLEQQTYIKRTDNIFEYLTDKERDIEAEIKNTDLDVEAITGQMSKIFFDVALSQNKFRYEENDQDFSFTKKVDGLSYGRTYELGIHIRTDNQIPENLRVMSLNDNDLVVSIPEDDDFYRENRMYLQTEIFVMQNNSRGRSSEESLLIQEKSRQNMERFEWIKRRANELLGQAAMYVSGDDVVCRQAEAKTRIATGFQRLIQSKYPNLAMLGSKKFYQNEVAKYIEDGKRSQSDLFDQLSVGENELLATINLNSTNGINTTVLTLLNTYERMPYGWPLSAVVCLVARLYGLAKIEISFDSRPVDQQTLVTALNNSTNYSRLVLRPARDIPLKLINRLKQVYTDTFHEPVTMSEAKGVGLLFETAVNDLLRSLDSILREQYVFSFLSQLEPAMEMLRGLRGKSYDWYYDNIDSFEDALPELMDSTVNPILAFMAGSQRQIYQSAKEFLERNSYNLQQVAKDEASKLEQILMDPNCFRGNRMNAVKDLHESLEGRIQRQLKRMIDEKDKALVDLKTKLQTMPTFGELDDERRVEVEEKFTRAQKNMRDTSQIAELNDQFSRFKDETYPSLVVEVQEWGMVRSPEGPYPAKEKPARRHKPIGKVDVRYTKPMLTTSEDVDEYIELLRKALLDELAKEHDILV